MSKEVWSFIGKALSIGLLVLVLWGLIKDTVEQENWITDLQRRVAEIEAIKKQ